MFPGKPHEGYNHMPPTRRSPGCPSRGQCPTPSSPPKACPGRSLVTSRMVLHIVGHIPRRVLRFQNFWRQNGLVTCLVLDRETFLPGKGTDCGLYCRRRQLLNQPVTIGDGPVQAEVMSAPRTVAPRVTSLWAEWAVCVEPIKRLGKSLGSSLLSNDRRDV